MRKWLIVFELAGRGEVVRRVRARDHEHAEEMGRAIEGVLRSRDVDLAVAAASSGWGST